MVTVAVDFDDTLVSYDEIGQMYPSPGARKSLLRLKSMGCKIIIYTCRTTVARSQGNLEDEVEFIAGILEQFDFYYDEIFIGDKLIADIYIDDRAVPYKGDWRETTDQCAEIVGSKAKKTS